MTMRSWSTLFSLRQASKWLSTTSDGSAKNSGMRLLIKYLSAPENTTQSLPAMVTVHHKRILLTICGQREISTNQRGGTPRPQTTKLTRVYLDSVTSQRRA